MTDPIDALNARIARLEEVVGSLTVAHDATWRELCRKRAEVEHSLRVFGPEAPASPNPYGDLPHGVDVMHYTQWVGPPSSGNAEVACGAEVGTTIAVKSKVTCPACLKVMAEGLAAGGTPKVCGACHVLYECHCQLPKGHDGQHRYDGPVGSFALWDASGEERSRPLEPATKMPEPGEPDEPVRVKFREFT